MTVKKRLFRWEPFEIGFLAPTVVFVAVMMVLPLVYTLWLSLHSWSGGLTAEPLWVGVSNYVDLLLNDARFRAALARTIWFAGVSVVLQTILGVAYALLLNRHFLGRGLFRALLLLPMTATPVAVALIWRLMYQPQLGLINQLLGLVGLGPYEWISGPSLSMWSLIIADTWQWTPLIALIVLAGLSALPTEPMEAAAVDGAGPILTFRHVTLPLLRPTLVIAMTLRLIEALKTFDLILVVTGGGPGFATETMNVYAYRVTFQYQQLGYSGALLTTFLVVIAALAAALLTLRRRYEAAI